MIVRIYYKLTNDEIHYSRRMQENTTSTFIFPRLRYEMIRATIRQFEGRMLRRRRPREATAPPSPFSRRHEAFTALGRLSLLVISALPANKIADYPP